MLIAVLVDVKTPNFVMCSLVIVDGQACASMEQRDKILKSYNADNVNQAKIRELIQGKNIVYIYHNQVDTRGDKAASENEVFNACAER